MQISGTLRSPQMDRLRHAPIQKPAAPSRDNSDTEDKAFIFLSGAAPLVGAGMNLAYGGMVAGLAQSKKLGGLALLGTAANIASLPLLATGNYLAAVAAMGISGATLSHIHHDGWNVP